MGRVRILEPMSTGDVIDRAVRLYRRNFMPLVTIVAFPCLFGSLVSLMFWFGYSKMIAETETTRTASLPADAMLLMALGLLGYLVWLFVLLLTVSGLSRVIADHVMLGEAITYRKFVSAIKRKIGDITLVGLILVVFLVIIWIAFTFILFLLLMLVGVIAAAAAGVGLPQWAVAAITGVLALVALGVGASILLLAIARVTFLPQIVMIEGQTLGAAVARAGWLGRRNWYRIGAIALFGFFVASSLVAALELPPKLMQALFDWPSTGFLESALWQGVSVAFGQLSYLLVLPVWVVSFTLLYFDNRVRKEAYDIELLVRDISPGFYWTPVVQQSAFGYHMPAPAGPGRSPVQTSPLSLAGYGARNPQTAFRSPPCANCGAIIGAGASLCAACGSPAQRSS